MGERSNLVAPRHGVVARGGGHPAVEHLSWLAVWWLRVCGTTSHKPLDMRWGSPRVGIGLMYALVCLQKIVTFPHFSPDFFWYSRSSPSHVCRAFCDRTATDTYYYYYYYYYDYLLLGDAYCTFFLLSILVAFFLQLRLIVVTQIRSHIAGTATAPAPPHGHAFHLSRDY